MLPETGITYLADFQFNDKTSLRQKWKFIPQINNPVPCLLQLAIPAFIPTEAIIAPENTVSFELFVTIGTTNLGEGLQGKDITLSIVVVYNDQENASQLIDIPVKMEHGTLIVTV